MRLAHKDFDALQRAILELYQLTLSEGFHKASLQILLKIIPADYSTWNGFTFDPMPKNSICVESSPRMTPAMIAFSERYVLSHPFTRYFLGTGDVSPLKLTDFISQRQLRSSPAWEAYYRPLGVSYCLSVGVSRKSGAAEAASIVRELKDFSERDRLILKLLRPHLIQAVRIANFIAAQRNSQPAAVSATNARISSLSPREAEVAHWVAEGKTNLETAMILRTSPRTIEKHMENILSKLGVENRTAAAAALIIAKPPHNKFGQAPKID